jgi:hypothetical protein
VSTKSARRRCCGASPWRPRAALSPSSATDDGAPMPTETYARHVINRTPPLLPSCCAPPFTGVRTHHHVCPRNLPGGVVVELVPGDPGLLFLLPRRLTTARGETCQQKPMHVMKLNLTNQTAFDSALGEVACSCTASAVSSLRQAQLVPSDACVHRFIRRLFGLGWSIVSSVQGSASASAG